MRSKALDRRQHEARSNPKAAEKLADYAPLLIDNYGEGIYAAYIPIRSEISPLPLVEILHKAGLQTAMPITPAAGHPLTFRIWKLGDPLETGPYGTRQPSDVGKLVVPDVILAPLLAYDSALWRLGYGGGFYDRTIADLASQRHKVSVIGLGYDGQKFENIPTGQFDRPLDAVLTPAGLCCSQP